MLQQCTDIQLSNYIPDLVFSCPNIYLTSPAPARLPSVTHKGLFTAHFTFYLGAGNINQTTTLTLFAAAAEANGQEIVAIKTTLAKVSQIREMKLVTLQKGREPVGDVAAEQEEETQWQ